MSNSESGNILFYILIGVAMLAALSFAVTQGSRDSIQSVNADKQRLLATEIIDYGDTMQKAVAAIRLRGTPFASLSFAHPDLNAAYGTPGAAPAHEIFNPAGGGVLYRPALADVMASGLGQPYIFSAGNEIQDVGTTCAADSCADLLLVLPGLKKDICSSINAIVGVDNPGGNPPEDNGADVALFAGTASYAQTLGDESAGLAGKTAGCFYDKGATAYTYYQVLQAR
jgi:hypothetical protein